MSILDNLNKSVSEIKEQITEEKGIDGDNIQAGLETYFSQGYVPKMKANQYLKAAKGWIYGCVGVISDEIASIELFLKLVKKGEVTEVDDHEALDLIYRANNAMTRFDLIQTTFQYLELTGEAPWFISFVNGKPDSIILLRPDRLTVLPGKNGEMVGGYKYRVYSDTGVKDMTLEPHEVVPLKYVDPDQPLRGKGPLQAAAETVDLDNYSEKWNSQFFKNSATPNAALISEKTLSKDVRARLQKKLEQNYKGVDNSNKTMILEGGLKFEKLSLSQKDMDFIEQQKFSRDKILSIFRVPPTALGLTNDVTRANAEATDYVFAKRTIKPKMIRFIEQLNEFYLPLFSLNGGKVTTDLYFDFADPVPQNVDQLINRAQSGINAGYMTINEARETMGLDPIEGGDILRDPMSFAPVSADDGQTPLKSSKAKVKPTRYQKHLGRARTRKAEQLEKKKEVITQVVSEAVVPIVFNYLKGKNSKTQFLKGFVLAQGTPAEQKKAKYAFQEKQLNVADQYEPKMISKLNSVFSKQKAIMLKKIEEGERRDLNVSVETERYLKALKPVMTDLMREQARLAFQILGIQRGFSGEITNKADRTFLQTLNDYFEIRAFKFATEVTKYTNEKLQETFAQALTLGESIPQIKRRVSELFEGMESYRSERIARTETIRASNFATEEAYKESGVVEGKEWLTTMDERTDDECIRLDGKVIPLGKNFESKKDNGYEAVKFPPIHVNCRCTLIPVVAR